MASQLVNSRQATQGKQYAEFYIDNTADLANLPQEPTANCCLGSVAYTAALDIFILTESGWEAALQSEGEGGGNSNVEQRITALESSNIEAQARISELEAGKVSVILKN